LLVNQLNERLFSKINFLHQDFFANQPSKDSIPKFSNYQPATRMSTQFQCLPVITRIAAYGLIGGILGFTIENWHIHRDTDGLPFRWFFGLKVLWEHFVTREWQELTPIFEDNGDTKNLPPANSPTVSCQVCQSLIYESPHHHTTPGTWQTRGTGWYDYFVEDLNCSYPRTGKWVASARQGCVSCQIVVDAVSSYSPKIFRDYKPELDDMGLSAEGTIKSQTYYQRLYYNYNENSLQGRCLRTQKNT
jgi:hypothetical protein